MAQVLVRNLPDDVVARLKARAANENKSLEQLLREVIEREVKPDQETWLAEIDAVRNALNVREPIDVDFAEIIRQGHEERDAAIWEALHGTPET